MYAGVGAPPQTPGLLRRKNVAGSLPLGPRWSSAPNPIQGEVGGGEAPPGGAPGPPPPPGYATDCLIFAPFVAEIYLIALQCFKCRTIQFVEIFVYIGSFC